MKIRKRVYPSGKVRWQLDLSVINGKRTKLLFDTKEEALGRLADLKQKRAMGGLNALSLTEAERIAFTDARDKLAAVGATLDQAVSFFLARHRPAASSIGLRALLDRCLADKERIGKRTRYLQQLRCSCLSFIRGREETPAHEVTRDQVETWIHSHQWAPKTQRVYLGDLRTLFAFAVAKGHARANPCADAEAPGIDLAQIEAAPIKTLTAAQAKQLLTVAARVPVAGQEDFRPLVTYAALGLFCGIRPAELGRLDRAAVSLTERHAVIEASQSKTRSRRVVDISENAVARLVLDPGESAQVAPTNFRRRWARLRMAAGWKPEKQAMAATDPQPAANLPEWPHDVMRHTFASMHYSAHQNESLLKAQMGHSAREDVLFRHYRALKTRAEAAAFWSLRPDPPA